MSQALEKIKYKVWEVDDAVGDLSAAVNTLRYSFEEDMDEVRADLSSLRNPKCSSCEIELAVEPYPLVRIRGSQMYCKGCYDKYF